MLCLILVYFGLTTPFPLVQAAHCQSKVFQSTGSLRRSGRTGLLPPEPINANGKERLHRYPVVLAIGSDRSVLEKHYELLTAQSRDVIITRLRVGIKSEP